MVSIVGFIPPQLCQACARKNRARELRACKKVVAGEATASDLNSGKVNRGATHKQGDGAERGRRPAVEGRRWRESPPKKR